MIEDVFSRIAILERNIVDMQRNVYIYKDTNNQGSKSKVENLYENVSHELENIKNLPISEEYQSLFTGIQFHLGEYKSNFDSVIKYARELEEFNEKSNLDKDIKRVIVNTTDSVVIDIVHSLHLAQLHSQLYFSTFDSVHVSSLKRYIDQSTKAAELIANDSDRVNVLQLIDEYRKKFTRLVAANRNYVFLINVVMTGNANEILYNSKKLTETFLEKTTNTQSSIRQTLDKQVFVGTLASFFGVFCSVLAAVFFFRRIILPIFTITHTFKLLSEQKNVDSIPNLGRMDEIGELFRAANKFKIVNEKTVGLLDKTTESVKMQQELNQLLLDEKQKVEKALSVRTDFLSNMSHELRTPLNSIIGFTVRLLKTPEDLSEKQIRALGSVSRNGQHLLEMINDILDLSKIEADKMDLHLSEFRLDELVRDAIVQLEVSAEDRGLEVHYDLAEITITSDMTRVNQLILNVLSNAIKYTEKGSVRVITRLSSTPGYVDVEVKDTGIGIKAEDQVKLFERFERFNEDSDHKVGMGTGLGLAIVDKITRMLSGNVDVKSTYGEGSTFTLTLPIKIVQN